MAIRLSENTLRVAKRMSRIGREDALEVLVRARELEAHGQEIIHLEIGDPDFPTPSHVIEAGARALREGWTHYGPPAGLILESRLRKLAEEMTRRRKDTARIQGRSGRAINIFRYFCGSRARVSLAVKFPQMSPLTGKDLGIPET